MTTDPDRLPSQPRTRPRGTRNLGDGPEQVVLLAADGTPIGAAPKGDVHGVDTPLHLAFSCYLLDDQGRVLLTRRALGKATWPGVWSNTCCGHPQPGEHRGEAVHRRLYEELGVEVEALHEALPAFSYRAVDASGIVENEVCPVWVGRLRHGAHVAPDPAEVMDTAWVAWPDLVSAAHGVPQLLSPWAVLQVPQLEAAGAAPTS